MDWFFITIVEMTIKIRQKGNRWLKVKRNKKGQGNGGEKRRKVKSQDGTGKLYPTFL